MNNLRKKRHTHNTHPCVIGYICKFSRVLHPLLHLRFTTIFQPANRHYTWLWLAATIKKERPGLLFRSFFEILRVK